MKSPVGYALASVLALACAAPRRYYVRAELPILENTPELAVAPGPWRHEGVPVVIADTDSVPDDLVLPVLKALMALPGAADACDPSTGRARPDASEYCVALYRSPQDWRVSWPIRNLTKERDSCTPPFGGVDDEDFGRDLPILGFAHNHPCGALMSSPDLVTFPALKTHEGVWTMVSYATSPGGTLVRDSQGQPVPASAWLATGHLDSPRFYKWNPAGQVFRWSEVKQQWEFRATCQPQDSSILSPRAAPPRCVPELE